jgi:hypothetical protein
MASGRMEPIRSKVCISDRILKQIIALIICYIMTFMKKHVLKAKTENLSKYWEIKGSSSTIFSF